MSDDEYIIIPPTDTVPLSHYYCNNSPVGISTGNSSWFNGTRRQYMKFMEECRHEQILNQKIGRRLRRMEVLDNFPVEIAMLVRGLKEEI